MSYSAKRFGVQESAFGNMGIPPHDHVVNSYDGANNLIDVKYYRGGQQASGNLVAHIELTYDSSGNLATVTRTK
jgi:hypothetical protein